MEIPLEGHSTRRRLFFFHQKFSLKFKDETNKVPLLEYSFVWCLNLETSESKSEMPGKF
jgi:hypothetical protein